MKDFFMSRTVLNTVIILLMALPSFPAFSQSKTKPNKIALVIGIGKYQPGNGWKDIHGDNDVYLIRHALVNAGFSEENIYTLKNESATKAGILEAFKQLSDKVASGDIVVLHFSCHGQQITDTNGDEADGFDEALVPYDAPSDTKKNAAYTGDNHLTDDELQQPHLEMNHHISTGWYGKY